MRSPTPGVDADRSRACRCSCSRTARRPNRPDSDPPYTYVTGGIRDAVELAKQAAGDEKVVALMGSSPVRQALAHGLLDEITLHVVPVLLGAGVRLLDEASAELELESVVQAPGVTHVTYAVVH